MKVWGNCVLHLMIIHWVVLIGFGFHSTDYRYVYCLFLVIANLGPLPMYVHVWCSSTPCWLADCYCRKTNLMATFPEWKSRIVLRECFSLLNHHSLVVAFRWCFYMYGWAAWCGIPDRAPHPVITIMHYMNLKIHVHVVCMQTLINFYYMTKQFRIMLIICYVWGTCRNLYLPIISPFQHVMTHAHVIIYNMFVYKWFDVDNSFCEPSLWQL